MQPLPRNLEAVLDPSSIALVKELYDVGSALRAARLAHENIREVIADVKLQKAGFKLKAQQTIREENANMTPLFQVLGENIEVQKEKRISGKFSLTVESKKHPDIYIDGETNFRDGRTNSNWAVYKSIKDDSGNILSAAIYVPSANVVYLANAEHAYTIELAGKHKTGSISELRVSKILRDPFTAEYGSWHKVRYSIAKAIFSTLVRENIGGSIRESGMEQLPLIWVANGERGIAVMNNTKANSDKTGAFIAQKAGVIIAEVPITSDPYGRSSIFSLHPKIANSVLKYFDEAMKLSQGMVIPGETKIYGPECNIKHNTGRA